MAQEQANNEENQANVENREHQELRMVVPRYERAVQEQGAPNEINGARAPRRRARVAQRDPSRYLQLYTHRETYNGQSLREVPPNANVAFDIDPAYAHNNQANVEALTNGIIAQIRGKGHYDADQNSNHILLRQDARVYKSATNIAAGPDRDGERRARQMGINLANCSCCLTAMIRKYQMVSGSLRIPKGLAVYGPQLLRLYREVVFGVRDVNHHNELIHEVGTLTDSIYAHGRDIINGKISQLQQGGIPEHCARLQPTQTDDNLLNGANVPLKTWLEGRLRPGEAMEPAIAVMCDYITAMSHRQLQSITENQYRDLLLGVRRVIEQLAYARHQVNTLNLGSRSYDLQRVAQKNLRKKWGLYESRVLNSLSSSLTRIRNKLEANAKIIENDDTIDSQAYPYISHDVYEKLENATNELVAEAWDCEDDLRAMKVDGLLKPSLLNLMDTYEEKGMEIQ